MHCKSGHLQQRQVNVLSYLEYLASSQVLANKFLASDVVISLLGILETSKVIHVQVKALTTLGLLIRHSTFMPDHLAQESFVEMLVQVRQEMCCLNTNQENSFLHRNLDMN